MYRGIILLMVTMWPLFAYRMNNCVDLRSICDLGQACGLTQRNTEVNHVTVVVLV